MGWLLHHGSLTQRLVEASIGSRTRDDNRWTDPKHNPTGFDALSPVAVVVEESSVPLVSLVPASAFQRRAFPQLPVPLPRRRLTPQWEMPVVRR
jgi:hypothetical protein